MRYNESSTIEDFELSSCPCSRCQVPLALLEFRSVPIGSTITNTSKTKNREKRIINLQSFVQIIEKYLKDAKIVSLFIAAEIQKQGEGLLFGKKIYRCGFNMMAYGAYSMVPLFRAK